MSIKVRLLPPNVPIVDANGYPTKEFYELLVAFQRRGLSDLPDVDTSGGVSNGEVLIYNSTTGKYEPGAN